MLIEIIVFPGVDELDAVCPLEVLRNAAAAGADFQVRLVSLEGTADIAGSHGLCFSVDGAIGSAGRPDLLLVPGGGWVKRAAQSAWAEAERGAIPAAIARFHQAGTILASICTGAMLIAAADLLRGRRAVTHHDALGDLRKSGAEVVSARIVDDGDIISAGGVTSGIDLALYLVERFGTRELANRIASNMEYERRGPVHVAAGSARSVRVQLTS
jgi:transcriptional regulator GlxA family with amidase domain